MNDDEKISALARLAGHVSHELNNILMVIDGNLSLAWEQDAVPDSVREMVAESLIAVQRGIRLSENLQAFAGRQALHPVTTDLRGIVRAVTQAAQQELEGTEIHTDLPDHACTVRIDPYHAEASLFELVRNAHAATSSNGVIRIEMALVEAWPLPGKADSLEPSQAVRLTITDNGGGLSPAALARAVEPMFTLRKGAGARAGWGLSLADGFVRQSGGTMSLRPAGSHGLRVDIHLPSVPDSAPPHG